MTVSRPILRITLLQLAEERRVPPEILLRPAIKRMVVTLRRTELECP